MKSQTKGRRIVAWILTILISLLLIVSAIFKFIGPPEVIQATEKWGLQNHLTLIAVGELVSALLFLIPRTHSLGVLMLSAYYVQAVLLVVIWIVGYLRHPELLQSFRAAND